MNDIHINVSLILNLIIMYSIHVHCKNKRERNKILKNKSMWKFNPYSLIDRSAVVKIAIVQKLMYKLK